MYQMLLLSLEWDDGELCKGFELKNIWNMDQRGCFIKALPVNSFAEKEGKFKGEKRLSNELQLLFRKY